MKSKKDNKEKKDKNIDKLFKDLQKRTGIKIISTK